MGDAKIRILKGFVLAAVKHSRDENDAKGPGVHEIILLAPSRNHPRWGKH